MIKREYTIEFACENRRYFDVRRWGIYEQTERAGIYECVWERINMDSTKLLFR